MNPREYYSAVFHKLEKCFEHAHYLVAAGRDLLVDGWDPNFLVAVESTEQLKRFTIDKGMQVHLPVVGRKSHSVLMPLDMEIFLLGENHQLYTNKDAQKFWFVQSRPVTDFVEKYLRSRSIPYLLDYTPSGSHILWQNIVDDRPGRALQQIGWLEEDQIAACRFVDSNDIKRKWGVSLDAAKVFSGLTKLAEYLALLAIEAFDRSPEEHSLPLTISDSIDRCVNFDNSWCEGSPFMRSIRSPYSLHKKNHDKYFMFEHPPLVDVVGAYFDGSRAEEETDMNEIVDCMWDLKKASRHAARFEDGIPESDSSLIDLIDEYRASALYAFHEEFEKTEELPRYAAVEKFWRSDNVSEHSKNIIRTPNPLTLQPKNMLYLARDLLLQAKWKPRHIANLLRDVYINPEYSWTLDFFKYPADEKANFWARTFSALVLTKSGGLSLT